MTVPPVIQLIHASDAPHHAAELKSIMMRMKSENRISDLLIQDITLEPFALSPEKGKPGGIVILLTHEVERARNHIEQLLMNMNPDMRQLKLIEIIVDNVPYNNHFISFPQDLKPIRSRDDMNLVWKGIEEDLEVIFPKVIVPEMVQTKKQPFALKNYVILIALCVLSFLIAGYGVDFVAPELFEDGIMALALFASLHPVIIFLLYRTELKRFDSSNKDDKWIVEGIDWKQLVTKIGAALAFFMVANFVVAIVIAMIGLTPGLMPSLLAMLATLIFLYHERKRNSLPKLPAKENNQQSSVKRFFRFLGFLIFSFLVSGIFWTIIFEYFFSDLPDEDSYTILFTIITTFVWMFFRQRRKRTKTPA